MGIISRKYFGFYDILAEFHIILSFTIQGYIIWSSGAQPMCCGTLVSRLHLQLITQYFMHTSLWPKYFENVMNHKLFTVLVMAYFQGVLRLEKG
jgi:hypothetical protein